MSGPEPRRPTHPGVRTYAAIAQVTFAGFGIQADGVPPEWFVEGNGLFAHVAGGVYLRTGVSDLDVPVEVQFHPVRPPVQIAGWEEVAEFSTPFEDDYDEHVDHVLAVGEDVVHGVPPLNFDGPGDYRCRVHVRGRWEPLWEDLELDVAPPPVVKEAWMFQFWREPASPDVFLLDDPRRESPYR